MKTIQHCFRKHVDNQHWRIDRRCRMSLFADKSSLHPPPCSVTVRIPNLNGLSVIYAQAPCEWLTPHPSASGPSCPGRLQSSWGLGSLVCPPGGQRAAYGDRALDLWAMSNIVTRGPIGASRPAKTTQHNSMDASTVQLQPITLMIPVTLFPLTFFPVLR